MASQNEFIYLHAAKDSSQKARLLVRNSLARGQSIHAGFVIKGNINIAKGYGYGSVQDVNPRLVD